jgi:sulfatase maturation enzyme AslB (radical SAM superfamily)
MVWPTAMIMRMLAFLTIFNRLVPLRKTNPYSSERVRIAIAMQTTISTINLAAVNIFAGAFAEII